MNLSSPVTNEAELKKALAGAFAKPDEGVARQILADAGLDPASIEKSITTGTGLVAYDLQAPAKELYPVYTPIRNVIPRQHRAVAGLATNWRQINSIAGSGWDSMGWVPEGQRSGVMSYNTSNKSASYVTIGEEDSATFEAVSAGRGFEDVLGGMAVRLLQKMMLKEEMSIIFGNNSLALGTPSTPTLSAAGTGATLPAATYSVIVAALTGEGYANAVKTGTLTLALSKTVTGADGKTYTLNGGTSNKSTNATQAVTLGQTLSATLTAIRGAVAYAWFVGTAGSETLQAITTINSIAISAPLLTGNQAATAIAADYSNNNGVAYDGLFVTAANNSSGAYFNSQATGTPGVGTPLTASGRGSVNEIDAMMLALWNQYQLSIDVLYVNAQELKNITTKVLTGASGGSLVNYFQDPKAGEFILTAGGVVEFYYNPYMAPGAGRRIPIHIHPQIPPGTIVGWAKNLPIQYQNNHVPNIVEMLTRQDYYQINWPIITRSRQVGVYSEQVLAVYAPFGFAVLSNIANG